MQRIEKLIFSLFATLFFFVPIVLWPYTSEVFEFNKIVLTYVLTGGIVTAWLIKIILAKKIVFRRTLLDIPLLVFLTSQTISTLLSIDPHTSFFGYYSRFNGGLLSIICYSLLYWAFVSNINKESGIKLIYTSFTSALLVSIYAVLEHFGIDKDIWVQDVQNRVFSTLGQPNWLAAWIVALIPLAWYFTIKSEFKSKKFWLFSILSVLFFWTLVFTKSRSGFLGLGTAFLIFWGIYFWTNRKNYKKHLLYPGVIALPIILIVLISGTPWTPNLKSLVKPVEKVQEVPTGPALEVGGTNSGTIRKIVWKGALDVFKHYPITGSGVETFAYSYYQFRPQEHNLVSEWDFIYNKAHNEYLNYLATTGILGFVSYLILIGSSIILIFKSENEIKGALLAGYSSLLVTNFFGFSVIPTQLEFFLFPALLIAIANETKNNIKASPKISNLQKFLVILTIIAFLLILIKISNYWKADTLFAKAKANNEIARPDIAVNLLTRAIKSNSNEALYHNELAQSYLVMAQVFNEAKNKEDSQKYLDLAIDSSNKAVSLAPNNVNLKRSRFGLFIRLSLIDTSYLLKALETIEGAIILAPTDAKLLYNLGLTYARVGRNDDAIKTMEKTIEMKPNYLDARLAYSLLLAEKGEKAKAIEELEYILTNIDPENSLTKQTLEGLK